MKHYLPLFKPLGLSPLQAIHRLRQLYPEYRDIKLGYAGRLDPLADGLLLLLIGEENKKKKLYEALPKTYEFEVLFGISTDTYDTLGIITAMNKEIMANDQGLMTAVRTILPGYLGRQNQPYPPYSSRTVQGKPLYKWAREGRLHEITIPDKLVKIYSLDLLSPARNAPARYASQVEAGRSRSEAGGSTSLSSKKLERSVMERIQIVRGEFRQEEIRSSWQAFFDSPPLPRFPIFRFRMTCSSGTYVRSLAHRLGEKLGIPSLAYSITRTAIGSYSLKDVIKLDPIA